MVPAALQRIKGVVMEGYKTVLFFALALLVWLANQFGFGDWQMSPELANWFEAAVIVGGLILRYFTKSAIFKKPE